MMLEDELLEETELTDLHRAVVQFMMRLRMVSSYLLTEEVFRKMYNVEFTPEDTSSINYTEKLETVITQINNSLHDLGFLIKRFKRQYDAELFYVFINTASDEVSKLMTTYSPKDIQAINRLIELIIKTPEGSIDETDASNVVTQATDGSYTKSDSLKLLGSLVNDRWIESDPSKKRFMLSGRLLAELGGTLKNQYGSEANSVF